MVPVLKVGGISFHLNPNEIAKKKFQWLCPKADMNKSLSLTDSVILFYSILSCDNPDKFGYSLSSFQEYIFKLDEDPAEAKAFNDRFNAIAQEPGNTNFYNLN